jgi:glycosyltransferase involved in cell wall biosynthesis
VLVTGHVPDVRRYLRDASVSIAPLRIARGTQNKILESMAMGIPVVATPEAAKGITAVPGRDLIVADDDEAFAHYVVNLLGNADRRRDLSRAARRQVEDAHLWSNSLAILDNLVNEVGHC